MKDMVTCVYVDTSRMKKRTVVKLVNTYLKPEIVVQQFGQQVLLLEKQPMVEKIIIEVILKLVVRIALRRAGLSLMLS